LKFKDLSDFDSYIIILLKSFLLQFVMLDILAEAMIKQSQLSKGYLIDGYPRDIAQVVNS